MHSSRQAKALAAELAVALIRGDPLPSPSAILDGMNKRRCEHAGDRSEGRSSFSCFQSGVLRAVGYLFPLGKGTGSLSRKFQGS